MSFGWRAVQVDEALEADLADLQQALALGPKEAGAVREEVISTTYRRAARHARQQHVLATDLDGS